MRLFAKNIKGQVKEWSITPLSDTEASICTGLINGNQIETIIFHENISKEIASRIAKKRKEGYVSLKDIGWIEPGTNVENAFFSKEGWLQEHLPKCNTDHNNNLKPMKCQRFSEGIMHYPVIAQPKLNGLRCVLRWEEYEEGEGLFKTKKERPVLRTKEGLEYYMPHITSSLTRDQFYSDGIELVFDGELYCHRMPLNIIKSSCPMINTRGTLSNPSGNPKDIKFYTFDLAIPDVPQHVRLNLLWDSKIYTSHIGKVDKLVINNDEEAIKYRDLCIQHGFEGIVLRELDAEYAFGFRPKFIRKFKTHLDSEFLIIDVLPKPSDPTLPLFLLKNDINDETFECNPMGDWEYQREILQNKENYIGKLATVRYRERSGVKKVPFHANVIDIRDKE